MQEHQRVRAGIAGLGSWARMAHLPALLANPDVAVVAVADTAPASLAAASSLLPEDCVVYADPLAMLAEEQIDLVCIVTPDDAHGEPVRAAVAAGTHIVCEKPLAITGSEAWELSRLAEAAGLVNRVGFTVRYSPAMTTLNALIGDGAIGIPHLVLGLQQNGQFLDPAKPFHWKMDKSRTGGGAIVEYGIHTLDLALWLGGPVCRVQAIGQTLVPERPLLDGSGTRIVTVDDSTGWLIEYENGGKGIGHAGWATPGRAPGLEFRVYGSNGAARVELSEAHPGDEALWLSGPDGNFERVTLREPEGRPWYEQWIGGLIDDTVDEILGRPHRGDPTFVDGARAQDLLDAALNSMETGAFTRVGAMNTLSSDILKRNAT
jgi:predicted dehydrogenase